jgi:hypothetical protein
MTLPDHYSKDAREAWSEWLAWRKKQKWPCTERVERLALQNLAEYERQGHSPESVIDHSMFNGWRALFAPKTARPHKFDPILYVNGEKIEPTCKTINAERVA